MTAANDYPRWMFHPTLDPVIIQSEDEEAALGPGWSRKIGGALGALPEEEKPLPDPEEEEPEPDEEPEEPAETAPVKRGRGKRKKP